MSETNEAIQKLESKIQSLEARIDKLSSQYDRLINYMVKPTGPTDAKVQTAPVQATVIVNETVQIQTTPHKQPEEKASKTTEGVSFLLPLVAVICFVLAGVFIVKLAVDSGWLTIERQWGLLTVLGLSFVGVGRYFNKIEKNYRQYLSATGIIVLFIAAYSSALYFKVVSQEIALVMAMGVSFICLALFQYHRSEFFAILCSVGTYVSPILLGAKGELIFHSEFFIIWAFLFSFLASYLHTRVLSLTAAYLGIGIFTMLFSDTTDIQQLYVIVGVIVVQFFAFASGVYYYSMKSKEALAQKEAIAYLPILLFFYGTLYYFLNKIDTHVAPWISIFFACFVYILYTRVKDHLQQVNSQQLVQSFLGVVIFHSVYLEILPDSSKPYLLPLFLLATVIADKKDYFPKMSAVIKLLMSAIGFIEFLKVSFKLVDSDQKENILPALLTVGLGLFYYFQGAKRFKQKSELFLGLVHLLSILAIFRLLYDQGSFAVSLGWGVYSALILAVGFIRRDPALAKSSLVVLLVTSLKALVYDASQSPSIIRIFSLLLTGVVLYVSGLFFKKIKEWPAQKS